MTWAYFPDGKLKAKSDDGVPVGSHSVVTDDDTNGLYTATGTWTKASATGQQGTSHRTHAAAAGSTDKFTWTLDVPADGAYTLSAAWPQVSGAATDAKFTLNHGDGAGTDVNFTANQTTGAAAWNTLGKVTLTKGEKVTVAVAPSGTGVVVADAVRLVRDNAADTDAEDKAFAYAYDVNGNLTDITDTSRGTAKNADAYAMAYDGLNQIKSVREDLAGSPAATTSYTYNNLGAPLTVAHPDQSSEYVYNDPRNLLTKVTVDDLNDTKAGKVTSYTYDALGRQKTITKGNGNVTTNAFQSDGALKSMREETSAGALVASHGYTYDANGNQLEDVASKKNADDASATLDSTTTYVYDPVDRLKGKTKTGHAASSETYVHDANANVIQQTVGGTSTSFNYDRNRLLSSTVDGQTASYRYDPFGRQTSVVGGGKTISRTTYDGFDHIKVAEKANDAGVLEATTYTYDPLDRTASKTTSGTDGKTTDYTYLGLSQEVLGEEVAGELTKSYQYSPWGQRLSQITHQADAEAGVVAGETGYYGYNAHTDVETVTDDTGKTVATYGYTAYGENDEAEFTGIDKPEAGNPEQPSDESFNAYRFNGKRWDAGSGTYDMGFRDYNPGLNTFTTRDMYNGALADMGLGIDPYSGSRYAFTAGNPISRIELDGHQFDAATGGGGNEATSSSACYPGSAGCGEPTSGPPKRDPYADVPVKCDHTGERCGNVAGFGDGLTIDGPTYEESQQNVLLAYILAAGAAACAVAPQGCAALALESVPGAEGVAAASAGAGALGLWRLLSRESGGAATGAAGHADHIVLGLESGDDLEKFASAVGGRTLMSDRNWKGTVWTASEVIAEDPSYVKISFSLDGMDGVENGVESVVGNSLLRDSRQIGGATDLEIAYLKQNDALQYVDFYIGGELQPNPFS